MSSSPAEPAPLAVTYRGWRLEVHRPPSASREVAAQMEDAAVAALLDAVRRTEPGR